MCPMCPKPVSGREKPLVVFFLSLPSCDQTDHTVAAIINKLTAASPLSRRTKSQPKSACLHAQQYSNMNLARVKYPARRYHRNSSFVITALQHLEFANLTWATETFFFSLQLSVAFATVCATMPRLVDDYQAASLC